MELSSIDIESNKKDPISIRFLKQQLSCALIQFHKMEEHKPEFGTGEQQKYQKRRTKLLLRIQQMERHKNLIIKYENGQISIAGETDHR